MPNLVSQQESPVEVDFNGWALQDWDDTQVPEPFPSGFQSDVFLAAHPGRLDFGSAGHTHTASLSVEVWDGHPPIPPGDWEETAEASILCTSGKLRARGVAAGPMPGTITLSDKPGRWAVRAVCAGRAEVAEQSKSSVPEGVERYTVQFWPEA